MRRLHLVHCFLGQALNVKAIEHQLGLRCPLPDALEQLRPTLRVLLRGGETAGALRVGGVGEVMSRAPAYAPAADQPGGGGSTVRQVRSESSFWSVITPLVTRSSSLW